MVNHLFLCMAKKKWGQNFLINPNVIESIIKIAKVKIGDEILEIGPGSGNLTQALLDKQSFVKAIEIDWTDLGTEEKYI